MIGALLALATSSPLHAQLSLLRLISTNDAPVAGNPLAERVSLTVKRVPLRTALERLARDGAPLVYSASLVRDLGPVSCSCAGVSLRTALDRLIEGKGITYAEIGGQVALSPAPPRADRLAGTVTGRVLDATSQQPIVGATVAVVGTSIGSVTGTDGRFTLPGVPAGQHQLHATMVGFAEQTQSVTVTDGATATVDFSLQPQAVVLEGVVSIGYGTQLRERVTGAVSSVTARDLENSPAPSVDQALQGRAPGVQVTLSSGQPGAPSAVRIRGGNSISAGNEPLYVIDGVPVQSSPSGANTSTLETQGVSGMNPLAAINPADIQSIDILKDASATAIYGARAANGVILVTTKRGRAGKSTISFDASYGVQSVRRTLPLLDAQEFATVANAARQNAGQPVLYTPAEVASLPNTDWQDAIFRSAPTQNYDLSFSGGSESTRYYLSGSLLRQEGVVLNTNLDRGSVRLNLDQDVSTRLRLGTRFTFTRSQGQVMPNGGAGQEVSSVLINALTAPPTLPIFGSGGEYFIGLNPANGRTLANPVASATLITNEERQNRFIGNVFGEYDLLPALTFRTTIGADYLSDLQDFYSPSTTYPGIVYGGYGSRGSLQATTWLNENTLHYQLGQRGPFRDLDLLGGVTFQRSNSENVSGTAQNFVTDALGQNGLNTGGTYLGIWTGAPHSSLLSYFTRANWSFADRYLFTLTGRVDGSSKFGAGNRYGFFPSGAFAWRLSQEPFMRDVSLFDDLKLRASYGRTGNQNIGDYRSLATLGSSTYLFNGTKVIGYAPNTLANPDLKWETTDQVDLGVDAAMLDNRLSVTADLYDKETNGLLLDVAVPSTLGYTSQLQNVGSVRNRGVDLGIRSVNLTGPIGWTSTLNVAWNRNRVTDIGNDTIQIAPVGVGAGANQNPTVIEVGQPINSFRGYVYDAMVNGQPTYKDLNGDGNVTTADQTIIGNAEPSYTGGFLNDFTFGNFDLSVFLQFSKGNEIYNINRALLTSNAGNGNQLTDVLQATTDGANGIPIAKLGNSYDTRPSTLFVEDGSYLRGKNIRFAYTLPSSLLSGLRLRNMSNAQLYVSAQNFFTVTDYTGFDPEVSEYATSVLAQGIDFGTYPQTRTFMIGLTAGF
jgi:TonB-linked SusC/RagA family outer membrane protein